jgi:diguanylate cyclase (GGDEF)-like protein
VAEGAGFSILLIDVDRFKSINDRYGHLIGDQVLRYVGASLTSLVRTREDVAGRYGGDEFVVFLKYAEVFTAEQVAERLLASVAEHPAVLLGQEPVPVRLSIGIATFPQDGAEVRDVFHAADQAMYVAKQAGASGQWPVSVPVMR